MPVGRLLQYMHFKVEWNDKDNAVCLIMNGQSGPGNTEIIPDSCNNDSDAKAIEIIRKIGKINQIHIKRLSIISLEVYCMGSLHIAKQWLSSGAKDSPLKVAELTHKLIPEKY